VQARLRPGARRRARVRREPQRRRHVLQEGEA
jgi:hypothetical protein